MVYTGSVLLHLYLSDFLIKCNKHLSIANVFELLNLVKKILTSVYFKHSLDYHLESGFPEADLEMKICGQVIHEGSSPRRNWSEIEGNRTDIGSQQ